MDLAHMRRDYVLAGLLEEEMLPNWHDQMKLWLTQAGEAGIIEPNAMVLATADRQAGPSTRTVLLKDLGPEGLTWFTHYNSRKGQELTEWPRAALCFSWPQLERQINIRGSVVRISEEDSESYWRSRPHASQIGSSLSPQSQPIPSRAWLEQREEELQVDYPERVPRPKTWGGFRLLPEAVEFWQGRPARLHDRLIYQSGSADGEWQLLRLAP